MTGPVGDGGGDDVWCIVLAGGSGARFGGHKQFQSIGGRRLVDRAVDTAASVCHSVVVVLPESSSWDGPPVAAAVAGGATRLASGRNGRAAVPPEAGIVVVHDAAHPLAPARLFTAVIDAVRDGWDAALPALPFTETIKRVSGGRVVGSVPREGLVLAQTPHAFGASVLRAAHAAAPEEVEDTVLVEAMGGRIAVVAGDPRNLHVSTPQELELAARWSDRLTGDRRLR